MRYPRPEMFAALLAAAVVVVTVVMTACGADDPAPRTSARGEACRVTADCAEGLACAPLPGSAGGACVTGQFHVVPTAKECAITRCEQSADCCNGEDVQRCQALIAQCELDAGPPSELACAQVASECGCANGRVTCEHGACVSSCEEDLDCTGSGAGRRCSGRRCVQCTGDIDCGGGQLCQNGSCQAGCSGDGDCAGFDRCVSGRCLPSGCQADRECVAATRNVDARCGTDGVCIVPCQTDLECGSPTSYSFFSCIEHECTYVGCESDKDCRLFFLGPSDASVLGSNQHVVCRDRGAIGDVRH
ncbi:MAG: hypothetical protein JWP97_5535 [Labilithrix sp.]|nr:hypothetical protein [Labilithrix sp.]